MPRPLSLVVLLASGALAVWAGLQAHTLGQWGFGGLAAVSAGLAIFLLYYLLFGFKLASVLVRTGMALVPVGGLSFALIYGVLQIPGLDPDVTRALIAAVIVAAGWVVGYLTSEWRRVGNEQERRRDLIRAAISELELIIKHMKTADWDQAITDAEVNFAKSARYDVFVFYGHEYSTLKRLVDQVEVLSWAQIEPVMDLYQVLDRLDRMEAKMELESFRALPKQRREAALVRYLKLNALVLDLAQAAVDALRDGPFRGWVGQL